MGREEATGWIKLYRPAIERDLGSNPILWAIWSTLLIWAYWKPSKILWEGKQRTLPPGAVVFGAKEIAQKWGISRSVVKKWLRHLHKTERIVLETCPRGMLATIRNWEAYQLSDREACPDRDDNVPTTCPQRATPKEVKKEKSNDLGPFNSKATELLSQVKPELIESWCETFRDQAWITERINAAANWVIAKKANKKDWGRFLNNWLNRKTFDSGASKANSNLNPVLPFSLDSQGDIDHELAAKAKAATLDRIKNLPVSEVEALNEVV